MLLTQQPRVCGVRRAKLGGGGSWRRRYVPWAHAGSLHSPCRPASWPGRTAPRSHCSRRCPQLSPGRKAVALSATGPQGAGGLASCFRGRPLRATRRKGWGLRGGGAGREGGRPHRDGGLAGIPAEPEQQGTGHLLLGHNLEVRTAREGSAPVPPGHADPAPSLPGQPSCSKSTPQGPTPSLESLGHLTSLCVATTPHPGPGLVSGGETGSVRRHRLGPQPHMPGQERPPSPSSPAAQRGCVGCPRSLPQGQRGASNSPPASRGPRGFLGTALDSRLWRWQRVGSKSATWLSTTLCGLPVGSHLPLPTWATPSPPPGPHLATSP